MAVAESIIGPLWEADLYQRLLTGASAHTINMPTIANTISAGELFGNQAAMCASHPTQAILNVSHLCDNMVFQLVVLMCFIGYCLTVYYCRSYIGELMSCMKSKLLENKVLEDQNYTFTKFMNATIWLGCMASAVISVKYIDLYWGHLAQPLPMWSIVLMPLIVTILLVIVGIYQKLMLKIIGRITFTEQFTDRLTYMKKLIFSSYIVLAIPTILLLALGHTPTQDVVSYIFLAETAIMIIFLLYKTYILFIEQNVSILHWFLYLCTVEIFPISILILIMLKNT